MANKSPLSVMYITRTKEKGPKIVFAYKMTTDKNSFRVQSITDKINVHTSNL